MREHDCHARSVARAECVNGRNRSRLVCSHLEWKAHIEDERPALVLDLDAAAADLVGAAVDARSHAQAATVASSTGATIVVWVGVQRSHSQVPASRTHHAVSLPKSSPSTAAKW